MGSPCSSGRENDSRSVDEVVSTGLTAKALVDLDPYILCIYGDREGVMQAVVRKWGNSAAVRIPSAVLEAAQVHMDQPVDVREDHGRIIIEPIRPARYTLEALLAGVTDANRHGPVEMGPPAGNEVW